MSGKVFVGKMECSPVLLPTPPRPEPWRLVPIFVPYAGCRNRCIYCHQAAQTGVLPVGEERILHRVETALAAVRGPVAVGLFGGSFTALPWSLQERILNAIRRDAEARGGLIHLRLSTRPDAVQPRLLVRLRRLGVDLVELGVQTFASAVLAQSGRDSTGAVAWDACRMVQDAGLALGVQLLPGLPGHGQAHWLADVDQVIALRPQTLRIYPCLLLPGTPLAERFRRGLFRPWDLLATQTLVAEALPRFWAVGIRVIRIGLAPQPGLVVEAGPHHPALGNQVRGLALVRQIGRAVGSRRVVALKAPWWVQGDLWGWRRSSVPTLARLGVTASCVTFQNTEGMELWMEPSGSMP